MTIRIEFDPAHNDFKITWNEVGRKGCMYETHAFVSKTELDEIKADLADQDFIFLTNN